MTTPTNQVGRETLNPNPILPWLMHCIKGIGAVASGAEKVFLVPGVDSFDDGLAVLHLNATRAFDDLKRVFGDQYPELFINVAVAPEV